MMLITTTLTALALTAPSVTLTVALDGVEADRKGDVRCAVYDSALGFPGEGKPAALAAADRSAEEPSCTFTLPAPGTYAVAVMHDENGNRKVDQNLFGAPTEGWATSNNVTHAFRGPSFDESKFIVPADGASIRVTMHY